MLLDELIFINLFSLLCKKYYYAFKIEMKISSTKWNILSWITWKNLTHAKSLYLNWSIYLDD